MILNTDDLKSLVELCDVAFTEKTMNLVPYWNKKNSNSPFIYKKNYCFEAYHAYDNGLLKDFEIKGLIPKKNFKMIKIKEYASGRSYECDDTDSGRMDVILVYKAFLETGTLFIACKTNIIFPMLVRHVVSETFRKILLPPYISFVDIWASDTFEELMENGVFPHHFYMNKNIDKELFDNALFMLKLYGLDTEEQRCLMFIDDGNYGGRYCFNMTDLRNHNMTGRYLLRPYLNP